METSLTDFDTSKKDHGFAPLQQKLIVVKINFKLYIMKEWRKMEDLYRTSFTML